MIFDWQSGALVFVGLCVLHASKVIGKALDRVASPNSPTPNHDSEPVAVRQRTPPDYRGFTSGNVKRTPVEQGLVEVANAIHRVANTMETK